jgi:hypothetical protein
MVAPVRTPPLLDQMHAMVSFDLWLPVAMRGEVSFITPTA